ncbi:MULTISPECIES: SHOCT domain-containing protein [Psychrilyobacter]|uniref:SHOCT domain-containing protein n=1 Tax=Psychrilyobacter piezotolerans TaxID=2293438 RepID=A0ABX9KLE2_9FUSO|nr:MULTISPECIES: SHOCT domain-containing protein [Psychrilyobacter]MCS5423055.1 SHOCT domain-containing protein [Psychrilyobacter sp. S5]NDI76443.1 SHOCT domain-containing protein [Psychrilyobacter piezotolerans]RDE66039.1 SHOCT domain-containing protein [Psychrilyobacter sp. S5]REI43217.1 SHOCT domain-containing protein [Psychrilyobacter piezotolerans]
MGYHMMDGLPGGVYWVFMLFRGVAGFIFPIILLYLVYRFMKGKEGEFLQKSETPLERLKMRLAKGEITKEEYEELKKIIED